MSTSEQFPCRDRNPASSGLDLMPDVPIVLRHKSQSVSGLGLVDSGASISVLPYSLGIQLGFDWQSQTAQIALGGTLANVEARGIVVEAVVGKLRPVRLAIAWASSDEVPFLLGEFNFFQTINVCFFRARGIFEIRQAGVPRSL